MRTYQVEIKETLCMTVEVKAKDAEQAEAVKQHIKKNIIFSMQSILPAWILPPAKKK